jgi:hypothetical protein
MTLLVAAREAFTAGIARATREEWPLRHGTPLLVRRFTERILLLLLLQLLPLIEGRLIAKQPAAVLLSAHFLSLFDTGHAAEIVRIIAVGFLLLRIFSDPVADLRLGACLALQELLLVPGWLRDDIGRLGLADDAAIISLLEFCLEHLFEIECGFGLDLNLVDLVSVLASRLLLFGVPALSSRGRASRIGLILRGPPLLEVPMTALRQSVLIQ